MFQENLLLTLRQAQKKLAKNGIQISLTTIKRRLEKANLFWESTREKPLLSEKHSEKRLNRSRIDREWSSYIF